MAWPLAAMGIGALIGGMGAQQRGGSFLKGALTGAALGGVTGGLGAKFGGGEGMFGFGSKMLPNFLAMSGIGMGTEMMGQQEANKKALEGRRRLFEEEEDERIARLSRIAGYDVADSKNFMTPQSYFGVARGGMMSRPGYYPGGIASIEDDPMDAVNVQEMQMDSGTMGPGELVEEFDFMEEAGSGGDESGWYEMFFNEFGRDPVDINELQLFIDQSDISPTDVAGIGQGPMMAAEGGQVNRPGYAWAGPVFKDHGFDTSGGETRQQAKATQMGDKGLWTDKWFDQRTPMAEDLNQLRKDYKRLGEGYIDQSGTIDTREKFFNQYPNIPQTFDPWKDLEEQYNIGEFPKKAPEGYFEKWGAAGGGSVMGKDEYDEELNRPGYAPGGIADLDLRGGGHSIGPGTGTSDDIPAMLSDGEFVVTANAVKNLGGGDRMEGARRMYSMMNQLDPQSQTPGEMNYAGRG